MVFALFVFSVPFETLDLLGTGHQFSISRLIGLFMICVALTQPRVCLAPPPVMFWLFASYLGVLTLVGVAEPSQYQRLVRAQILTLVQLLVLFWISTNVLRFPRVARSTIAALAFATLLVSALNLAGIGDTVIPDTGRISMFGEDPNTIAGMLSLGIVAWVAFGRELKRRGVRAGRYWPLACVFLAAAVIRTGSRGGVVALMASLLALVFQNGQAGQRWKTFFRVTTVVVALVLGLLASSTNVRRWTETIEEGSAAGREKIIPAAWKMFLERPLLGWGPGRNLVELGARLGYRTTETGQTARDTHNGVLWVMTETGIVGSLPYVFALWLCLRAAWKGRNRLYGALPFALVVCVLLVNMSVTWHARKFYWLILGLGVASSRVIGATRARRRRSNASSTVLPAPVQHFL